MIMPNKRLSWHHMEAVPDQHDKLHSCYPASSFEMPCSLSTRLYAAEFIRVSGTRYLHLFAVQRLQDGFRSGKDGEKHD